MAENGDPLENAVAERENGIIKDEYVDNYQIHSIEEAKELLKAVIDLYNNERPHISISNFRQSEHGEMALRLIPFKLPVQLCKRSRQILG